MKIRVFCKWRREDDFVNGRFRVRLRSEAQLMDKENFVLVQISMQ